jgi:hypothetical protein
VAPNRNPTAVERQFTVKIIILNEMNGSFRNQLAAVRECHAIMGACLCSYDDKEGRRPKEGGGGWLAGDRVCASPILGLRDLLNLQNVPK